MLFKICITIWRIEWRAAATRFDLAGLNSALSDLERVLSAGLSALPGGVKFPDGAGAFHYEDSGKLLSVTSNRFIHW